MSPPSLTNSSSSKLNQFGLYRTIDERTEEFLKLSRKRQMRQGCVCAAISTAITVTIVVVILLIYEYSIVIESSLVQRRRSSQKYNDTVVINDTPVADRLDRTYFGFDQDYFEQMPLLVNAMQENSYIDPAIEIPLNSKDRERRLKYPNFTTEPTVQTSHRNNMIRRTSPRPFIFEYRSPTPVPFHKNYNSRSWIDSYRNAQRLKNLEQVIGYLEKTINAKFGDLYAMPTTAQIAFSGVYVQPTNKDVKHEKPSSVNDLLPQSSINTETLKHSYNHQSDPYFNYKPVSPGDVNLLADVPLKFSPSYQASTYNSLSRQPYKMPMFRPITRLKGCVGPKCRIQSNDENSVHLIPMQGIGEMNSSENLFYDKPKSFSVLLNLFSMTPAPNNYYKKQNATTHRPFNRIYITTPNPQIQFRRKSTVATSRRKGYMRRFKRPLKSENKYTNIDSHSTENNSSGDSKAKMILHFNVFSKDGTTTTKVADDSFTPSTEVTTKLTNAEYVDNTPFLPTLAPFTPTYPPYVPTCPGELCSTNVEDFHVGSSGVIPVELRTFPTTPLPKATTTLPFFDSIMTSSEDSKTWSTSSPEIFKFSKEDAKIPDEYRSTVTRRNFQENEYYIGQLEEQRTESTTASNHKDSTQSPGTRKNFRDHFRNFRQSIKDTVTENHNFRSSEEEISQSPVTRGYHEDNTQSPVTRLSFRDDFENIGQSQEENQSLVTRRSFHQDEYDNFNPSEEEITQSKITKGYYEDNTQSPATKHNYRDHFGNFRQIGEDNQSVVTRRSYQYHEYNNFSPSEEDITQSPVTRRNYYEDNTQSPVTTRNMTEDFNDHEQDDINRRTLIIKLKNYLQSTTTTSKPEVTSESVSDKPSIEETSEEVPEITTIRTYVPQINGHYRSVNQNSRNINSWLNGNSESERKRNLEITSVTGFKKPAPTYVEIRRNRSSTYKHNGEEDE